MTKMCQEDESSRKEGDKMMIIEMGNVGSSVLRLVWTSENLRTMAMYDNFVIMKIDDKHDHSDGKTFDGAE